MLAISRNRSFRLEDVGAIVLLLPRFLFKPKNWVLFMG